MLVGWLSVNALCILLTSSYVSVWYASLVLGVLTCSDVVMLVLSVVSDSFNLAHWEVILGYCISFQVTSLSLCLIAVLDLLCWVSWLYSEFYVRLSVEVSTVGLLWVLSLVFFLVDDLVSVALCFESQSVPLVLFLNSSYSYPLGIKGISHNGVGLASLLLVGYGLMGGVLLFYSLSWLFYCFGLVSLTAVSWVVVEFDSLVDSSGSQLVIGEFHVVCCLLFLSGGVKLALFPFHVWLCNVHVESSTVGSVLLAGVALKTGFYLHCLLWSMGGFIGLGWCCESLLILLLVGSLWSCWSLFFQVDTNSWIALFSVSHMNLFYLGAVSCCCEGGNLSSCFMGVLLFGMVCHSLVSAGLFLLVGWLADLCGSSSFWEVSLHGVNSSWICMMFTLLLINGGYPGFMLFCYEVLAFTWVSAWGLQLLLFVVVCSGTSLVSGLLTAVKFLISGYTASGLLVELLVLGLVIVLLGSGLGSILCLSWLVWVLLVDSA